MLKRKLIALNTALVLGVSSFIAIPSVSASYKSEIKEVEQTISDTQKELEQLEIQVQRVEEALEDNNQMIIQTEKDIEATNLEIQQLKEEISSLNNTIAKRTEVLKKRAQSFQESGGKVSYIEVLFGSESFSDFIDRIFVVSQIASADSQLIEQHELDKSVVEGKQAEVDEKLANLLTLNQELNGMKEQMLDQQQQNEELKAELTKRQEENINKKATLEEKEKERIRQEKAAAARKAKANRAKKSTKSIAFSAPANSGDINDVIKAGYKYIGNSVYVFGGGRTQYDVDNGRFDCSGFVHWAFAQAGYRVGASTDTLKYQGTTVSVNDMQPGDLVFFDTYKKDGHVGIYIGGGKFIGSQTSTGVAIADMTSGYYERTFNGRVKRIR